MMFNRFMTRVSDWACVSPWRILLSFTAIWLFAVLFAFPLALVNLIAWPVAELVFFAVFYGLIIAWALWVRDDLRK